jgi:hypothetical protein
MYFEPDTALLDTGQALCVALPAAGVSVLLLRRLGGRGWALVAPVSVVGSVAAPPRPPRPWRRSPPRRRSISSFS